MKPTLAASRVQNFVTQ